ncbi:hypothetical protein V3C99_009761 [Haemonchus contortus]
MGKRFFNRAAIGILILVLFDHGLCLSEKGRIALQKALGGVDLEKRLERLQKLGRHRGRTGSNNTRPIPTLPNLTGEDGALAAEDTPSGDGSSILEVNRVEGVDEYLFDGDIILTDEELSALENQAESSARKKRQISTTSTNWADNTVFYYFDATIPAGNQAYIKTVLKYLSGRTCLNFVEDATAPNRIQVFDGAGCYSAVGMRGGEQPLSLSQGCIVPAACGVTLTATTAWQTKKVAVGEAAIITTSDSYKTCVDWIKAPAGKKVQIRVTAMQGVNCNDGCWTHAIEAKIMADKKMTNSRVIVKESVLLRVHPSVTGILNKLIDGPYKHTLPRFIPMIIPAIVPNKNQTTTNQLYGKNTYNASVYAADTALRGVDLEKRRERLHKLGGNRGKFGSNHTRPIPILPDPTKEDEALGAEEMSRGDGSSIVDVNRVEGVDEYLFEGDIILTE